MKWEDFLQIAQKCPIINTENLLSGVANPASVEVQLSRWVKKGKLIQLKRSVYLLAEPYRTTPVNELAIAAILKRPSYISLEKALELHNLIPEAVHVYTSVTPKRQGKFISKAGVFEYRHIDTSLFWGYAAQTLHQQTAFIATPEKALCDFFYVRRVPVTMAYLAELRLQNLEGLNYRKLYACAQKFGKPKLTRAVKALKKYYADFDKGYRSV